MKLSADGRFLLPPGPVPVSAGEKGPGHDGGV